LGKEERINRNHRGDDLIRRLCEAAAHVLGGAAVSMVVTRREQAGPGPAPTQGKVVFGTHAYTSWGAQIEEIASEESRGGVALQHLAMGSQVLERQHQALRARLEKVRPAEEPPKEEASDA
jgi:hypothetical protein